MKKILKLFFLFLVIVISFVQINRSFGENGMMNNGSTNIVYKSVGVAKNGTTYYIDGENGNNNNSGLSEKEAWLDFEKVNETYFKPGDHLLLHSKSTWNNQNLHPKGNGTQSNNITIDFYDTDSNGMAVFESTRRPIINGGGTYSSGTFKRAISGAVQLVNQEFWNISNLEVTNTPELENLEGYKKPGDAQRAGILILGYEQNRIFNTINISNNYVHDVQSEYYLNMSGNTETKRLKSVGGIIVLGSWYDENGNVVTPENEHRTTTGFNDVTIENNIVQRVGLEGIRTKADSDTSRGNTFNKTFSNIVIRNNYLEEIAGDGIVLSEVKTGGLVDGNVAIKTCNADYGTQNYAGVWAMSVDDGIFQHNEVYGNKYGYNDAEAYDIDMGSNNVIYQYNYSHHNAGGFLLLMSDQRNSIVRYNISANDGVGHSGTNKDNPDGTGGSYNYKEQSIFHYWVKNDGAAMPLIHNNTFYVGDGVSTSLFGEGNSSDNSGTIANFHNNILYKEGSGTLKFLSNSPSDGSEPVERKMVDNPEKYFKNNIIWPKEIVTETSGATIEKLESSGNIFKDPELEISGSSELKSQLAHQEHNIMDIKRDDISDFTSKETLMKRASLFKLKESSPAIGQALSSSNKADVDFFGNSLENKVLDIGAQQVSNIEKRINYKDVVLDIETATGVYPNLPESLELTFEEIVNFEVISTGVQDVQLEWDVISPEIVNTPNSQISIKAEVIGITESVSVTANILFSGDLGDGKSQKTLVATQDAYVQKNDGNKAYSSEKGTSGTISDKDNYKFPYGVNYSGNYAMKLKNASSSNYNRRSYVEFDTSDLKEYKDLKNANLQLSIMRYDAWTGAGTTDSERLNQTQFQIDVYETESNWLSDTITWNNGPLNKEVPNDSFVTRKSFTNSDIIANQNTINIDISDYLRKIVQEENDIPKKMSFLLMISDSQLIGYDPDNSGFDAFTTQGAKEAYNDYLDGKLNVPLNFEMTPDTLAPKLVFSDIYELRHEDIDIVTETGIVPILPEMTTIFYSDGTNKEVSVKWPEISPDLYQNEGEFEIIGKASGTTLPIIAKISVTTKKIIDFKELPVLDRLMGTSRGELDLPTEVTAILDDDSEVIMQVISWDDDVNNYSPSSPPGTYNFPAAIEINNGISNPDELKVFQSVQTHAIPNRIEFDKEPIVVKKGEEYQIIAKVIGKEPHTEVDEWSSRVTYQLMSNDDKQENLNLPIVTENGLISTSKTTADGEYQVLAKSEIIPEIAEVFTFKVSELNTVDVDKSKLEAAVKAGRGKDKDLYTESSWKVYDEAISEAEVILADADATQAEVDSALTQLELVEKKIRIDQSARKYRQIKIRSSRKSWTRKRQKFIY